MAKKVDPVKEKAKRQRLIAIVGGVILVALLAFQLPRTMKMLKGQSATSSEPSVPASSTPGAASLAPPTLEGSAAGSSLATSGASADTSSDGVRDPSTPLPADAGQLVSFSRFKSKDPFRQQVTDCGEAGCQPPTAAAPAAAAPSPAAPQPSAAAATPTVAVVPSKPATAPASVATSLTTAVISINGASESVVVGKTFPAADPVFVLQRLTQNEARITIAGGSFESGAPAVLLRKGKTVTLQNTANGTRYVLRLLSAG